MSVPDKSVIVEERPEEGVAVIRLNRPDVLNALNMEVRRALAERFTALADDPSVKAVVLAGSEKAFAAGADIAEMKDLGVVEQYQRHAERLWRAIAAYPRPVIAAVRGYALGGGCELAMHADIIIAGQGAQFGQPEIRVGIMPGAGGTQRLLRAVGKYKAMKMLLTGKPVGAEEALSMGLVSEMVEDDAVETTAIAMAKTIAGMPPIAVEQIKEVVLAGQDAPLDTALALERKAMQMLFASADQKEGMAAFVEKRRPAYKGE
ncbi:enoyl-CoA hydratase [Fodinicurvata sp. EGI_FJ10296]|uniref:enoyl-CoA hydratase n=1 Tax=Fodinicurvata sp. EGI_FJ10296 TaxID=3231908 RepID=UPI003452B2B1